MELNKRETIWTQPALFGGEIDRALVIREPYASRIVDGTKKWEIRGSGTLIRGKIAIIAGGTGTMIGSCELTDVIGPLSLDEYTLSYEQRGLRQIEACDKLPYKQTFAWVMSHAKRFRSPVAYEHPNGAVIWVKLKAAWQDRLALES
ncbi:MAG: ASCH domain-containing protein [Paenibacillaceae bacterium]|nr:ASCH domain-containing protein [Paenibacillaceae bacterium]